MMLESNEKKQLFLKCKKSVQEIVGWKVFIFLPQSFAWRFFVIVTILVTVVVNTTKCFYQIDIPFIDFYDIFCDSIYAADVLLASMHYAMRNTRKLRTGKKRHIIFIIIDCLSLAPFKLANRRLMFSVETRDSSTAYYFHLNALLRVYQIPLCFSDAKKSTYKVQTYFAVIILELFTYTALFTHFLSCFLVLYFDDFHKKRCHNNLSKCMVENELVTLALLLQSYLPPFTKFPLTNYKALLMCDLFIGFIFTYGYVIPLCFFVVMKILTKYFEYSRKWLQFNMSVKNLTADKELKHRILSYFHYAWTYGKGNKHPDILKVFPICLKKNIFCDMHWDAIRHSELFKDLSMGCKRSLALQMTTEFLLPNTTLYYKNGLFSDFLYLESGVLQIMAIENINSPVLNLSSGTVLGEISLFLHSECKATVNVAEFSIIHLLNYKSFFRVLSDYPKDLKQVFKKVQLRLNVAKSTYICKTEVNPLFWDYRKSNIRSTRVREGNVKWIKQQCAALTQLHEIEKLKKIQLYRESESKYQPKFKGLKTELQHTSLYLPLICINSENFKKYDVVCIKMTFPWMMDPNCHFLFVWKVVMCILMVITVLLYPAMLGWFLILPLWFIKTSVMITLMYIIDVLVRFFTAVKIKQVVVSKFSLVLLHNLSCLSFYVDILAALPCQLLIYAYKDEIETSTALNLSLVNSLVKSYKLIPILNKWTHSPKPEAFIRTLIKYMILMIVFMYWTAAVFNLSGVECIFYDCGFGDWYIKIANKSNFDPVLASLSRAMTLALDVRKELSETDVYPSFLISILFLAMFHSFYIALLAESIASYVIEFSYELEYKRLMTVIYDYMGNRNMRGQLRNRVMETMQFMWDYDKGHFITESHSILDDVSVDLRNEVNRKWLIPILKNNALFGSEDEKFLKELCKKAVFLALPAKSLLQTFGTKPTRLYVIHRGFIQINSFIAKDIRLNISTPILQKENDIFPVLDAFSQSPSVITAIALTDCQLVVLDLEDVLSTVITHGSLKDLTDALKATNLSALSTAQLGLSKVPDVIIFDDEFHNSVFERLWHLGTVLKFILKKKSIESRNERYIRWEFSRIVCILICLISWPLVFGVCKKLYFQPTLIKLLCSLDCLSFIDFYIRLHIAYYNEIGIYITHPLATSWHYLSTAFIADFIAFAPNFHMFYFILQNKYDFHISVVVSHTLLRSVALYRILGFLSYLKDSMKIKYPVELFKYLFFIVLGVHYYSNLIVFCFFERVKEQNKLHNNHANRFQNSFKYYLYELFTAFSLMMKNSEKFEFSNYSELVATSVLVISGIISHVYIYSFLTLTSMMSNKNLTTYQYYMKSFVQYLNTQKAEDRISALAVQHFEHQWQKQKGYDPHKIFSKFPQTLHEDIIYPMYKNSLNSVRSLSKANSAFYRTLCRNIQEVYLQKGSLIIYKKQVENNIFFIHKGNCFIENSSILISRGSMIGDIKGKGIMKNTITARTNVHLLKIKSKQFFLIMSNFYTTKKEYELAIADADDYLLSIEDEQAPVSEILSSEKNNFDKDEFFVVTSEKEGIKTVFEKRKIKKTVLNPDSRTVRILNFCFMVDAYCTTVLIPVFVALRLFSPYLLTAIYILDIIWMVQIFVTSRTAFFDKKSGDYIFNKKTIMMKYLRTFNGLIFHILSILPIEFIAFACFGIPISDQHCSITSMCYLNRLFRTFFIYTYIRKGSKKLLANFYRGLLGILMMKIALINFCVCVYIVIKREKNPEILICYWELDYSLVDLLISNYLSVLNFFVGCGLYLDLPMDFSETLFRLFVSSWALFSKAIFLNQVLLIIYVTHETKSDEMLKLEQLEKYLSVRNVSPALFQRTQKYFCDLLDRFNEGAEPFFLNDAPPYIKRTIMQDLYTHHLSNCYVFQGLEEVFIAQLAERLQRFIFFPGDYITEKDDVDHSMYFIHRGEVNCIEADKNIKGLELTVDLFVTGEYFGVLQGIFLAYPHTNSFRAKTLTDILVLNYYNWGDLRAAFPEITKSINKKCMQYDAAPRRSIISVGDK